MAHTTDLQTRETLDAGITHAESFQPPGNDTLEAQVAALWSQGLGTYKILSKESMKSIQKLQLDLGLTSGGSPGAGLRDSSTVWQAFPT